MQERAKKDYKKFQDDKNRFGNQTSSGNHQGFLYKSTGSIQSDISVSEKKKSSVPNYGRFMNKLDPSNNYQQNSGNQNSFENDPSFVCKSTNSIPSDFYESKEKKSSVPNYSQFINKYDDMKLDQSNQHYQQNQTGRNR